VPAAFRIESLPGIAAGPRVSHPQWASLPVVDLDSDATAQGDARISSKVKAGRHPGGDLPRPRSCCAIHDSTGRRLPRAESHDRSHHDQRSRHHSARGPQGFGAAVYAASEGLNVVMLEANAPGGQSGDQLAASRTNLGLPARDFRARKLGRGPGPAPPPTIKTPRDSPKMKKFSAPAEEV